MRPVTFRDRLAKLVGRVRHPRRFAAYVLLKIAYAGRWTLVPVTPVEYDIEPINSCNFSCEHCQVTHWDKAKAQLDVDSFRRIVDQLPSVDAINLQGMGEPLMNKNQVDMLAEGERRGIAMRFHSNASACTEANAQRLLELNNTSVTFSIDASNAATFERVRPGSNFAQIVRNIKFFTRARGEKRVPSIAGWTVLTTENIRELPDILRLCGELGLDQVTLQPFLTAWGKDEIEEYVSTKRIGDLAKSYEQLLHEAHEIAEREDIKLDVVGEFAYSKEKVCPWPWQRAFVAANGDVVPCCIIADADVAKMGNVFEKPFAQIWNGEEYRTLRTALRDNRPPAYCQGCYAPTPAVSEAVENPVALAV